MGSPGNACMLDMCFTTKWHLSASWGILGRYSTTESHPSPSLVALYCWATPSVPFFRENFQVFSYFTLSSFFFIKKFSWQVKVWNFLKFIFCRSFFFKSLLYFIWEILQDCLLSFLLFSSVYSMMAERTSVLLVQTHACISMVYHTFFLPWGPGKLCQNSIHDGNIVPSLGSLFRSIHPLPFVWHQYWTIFITMAL